MKLSFLGALMLLSISSFCSDSIFSILPFEGKLKLKKIGLHVSNDGKKIVNVLQSTDYRKIVVLDENGKPLHQWYYHFSDETDEGIVTKPTADYYTRVDPSVSAFMTQAPLHSWLRNNQLVEAYCDEKMRNFKVVRTSLEKEVFNQSGVELGGKEFALTSFSLNGYFYILTIQRNSPLLTLYREDDTEGFVKLTISPDFSSFLQKGVVTESQIKGMNHLLPLLFMREEPMLHYNNVSAPGQFLPFEQNTSPVKYLVKDNSLTIITPAANGHFIEIAIDLISGSNQIKAIYTDQSIGDQILQKNNIGMLTEKIVSATTVKTIAVTDSLLVCGRTKRGTIVLMYYSRSTGTLKHIDVINDENMAQLSPLPGSYMVNRLAPAEPIGKESFLKLASADLSPMAINIIPSSGGELIVTVEATDGRIKFADVAGALVEAAVFAIPATSLTSAFLIGASSSMAGSLVGGALSALSNTKMQFITRAVDPRTFDYINNNFPDHADFKTARRIHSYLEQPEIKSTELIALAQFNGSIYLSMYDKQSKKYSLKKF
jgi:hypothetical protein